MKNIKVIFRLAKNGLLQSLVNRNVFIIFFLTKLARYGLFLLFLYFLLGGVQTLGGYSRDQILIFYLTFNVIDTIAQILFREVYRFRPLIISGGFDSVLVKPLNPLVRVLLGGPDFIDVGVLVVLLGVISWYLANVIHPSIFSLVLFICLIVNSLLISAGFHIAVLAMGIITLSVDHLIMIYRDLAALMRIPIDVFTDPLRTVLTFVIPVGIMFSFPVKALLGLLNWQFIFISFGFGIGMLFFSIKFWQYALTKYQSAGN